MTREEDEARRRFALSPEGQARKLELDYRAKYERSIKVTPQKTVHHSGVPGIGTATTGFLFSCPDCGQQILLDLESAPNAMGTCGCQGRLWPQP